MRESRSMGIHSQIDSDGGPADRGGLREPVPIPRFGAASGRRVGQALRFWTLGRPTKLRNNPNGGPSAAEATLSHPTAVRRGYESSWIGVPRSSTVMGRPEALMYCLSTSTPKWR